MTIFFEHVSNWHKTAGFGLARTLMLIALTIGATSAQAVDANRQSQPLFSGSILVPAGKQYVVSFTTQSNFKNARIAGNLQAQGGSGNDIRVLVMKGQEIVFDSGHRRSVVLSADFSEPGKYALVFDNGFSVLSAKTVSGTVSLVHWGVDFGKNDIDQQADAAHFQEASAIVQRLYAALRSDERIWGTSQLAAIPNVRLSPDASINATGNWATNTIQIFRGLFTLSDQSGDKGQDILAGALAHELSHIFYRHPGYGSSSQGVKGFRDEVLGVTALDRTQEKEADILGIRLACQAGFDPQGMLMLMRSLAQSDARASDFMSNHPAAIERVNYLQAEAANCHAPRQAPSHTTASATTWSGASESPRGSMEGPVSYWAVLSVTNKLDIHADVWFGPSRTPLDPSTEYVKSFFNRAHDILWVQCKDGYSTQAAFSTTGNQVISAGDANNDLFGLTHFEPTVSMMYVGCGKR